MLSFLNIKEYGGHGRRKRLSCSSQGRQPRYEDLQWSLPQPWAQTLSLHGLATSAWPSFSPPDMETSCCMAYMLWRAPVCTGMWTSLPLWAAVGFPCDPKGHTWGLPPPGSEGLCISSTWIPTVHPCHWLLLACSLPEVSLFQHQFYS